MLASNLTLSLTDFGPRASWHEENREHLIAAGSKNVNYEDVHRHRIGFLGRVLSAQ